ncbi:KN motif and ankyrin repeat domain-containing protein 4 isoform X2 [Nothobranchius furzeri]|uniref:KN motif and ankyrin repeat domains 4 n=2 Tax=Nothobranchius furzeri TaxID=105023 RepID=A0A1A7ZTU9_NOTFU|nr:KN motif and ankyrin repeat domain-containing protein 4 isoform X2 [Nothobranchius furzeri]KAF7223146.1 transcript variant X2 [Nothobranchius furzeri]
MSQAYISRHKMAENGVKGKPLYSVETPYGFQIDLDFLKYVDDIEKGNTIKRVPVQRRSKGPRASTLPRQFNPSGGGYRPSPWGSTGALGPRSQPLDIHHHHGYESWAYNRRTPLSPTGLQSLSEMEARIKEFDEQPFGEHIRPHLLRASSLPLTVLLRQESESTDDQSSLRSSRDRLGGRNTSCEDVFDPPGSPHPQDSSGLLRRLTEALECVAELEMQVRVIPELRAQICILQEERERLRLGLDPYAPPSKMNGTTEPCLSSPCSKVGIQRKSQDERLPRNHSIRRNDSSCSHEWKTSTDLDELLTVTSLQAKVAALDQKLQETELDLQRVLGMLREQQEESRRKDDKIEHLIRNPGVWVRAERVTVDQDGDETGVKSVRPDHNKASSFICTTTVTNGERHLKRDSVTSTKRVEPAEAPAEGAEPPEIVHHIRRIKSLLDQQWDCVCGEPGAKSRPLKHPDPKINSLQQEMTELLNILMSSKSTLKMDASGQKSKSLHSKAANEGGNLLNRGQAGRVAAAQVGADPANRVTEAERPTGPEGHLTPVGTISGQTDGGRALLEDTTPEKTAKTNAPGEQMEINSGARSSDTVSADVMSACLFLKDHVDNMTNPNDDMRKALVTVFEFWFSAAAEENSEACRVSEFLKDVRRTTPPLLAFLVNLADDNGNTVLHYSVSHCNYSIVSLLLDTGVTDVNIQNNAGYTAVMLASLTAPEGPAGMEVVRKLMELGNVNICSKQTGQAALHLAVRHGRVVMVRLLLSRGADANIQDNQGKTALMFASERGHTHIARLLLERSQCDLRLTDKRGRSALSIAMEGSHMDTATLLQAHAKARAHVTAGEHL